MDIKQRKDNISIKYIGYVAGKLGIASKKIVIKEDNTNTKKNVQKIISNSK